MHHIEMYMYLYYYGIWCNINPFHPEGLHFAPLNAFNLGAVRHGSLTQGGHRGGGGSLHEKPSQ